VKRVPLRYKQETTYIDNVPVRVCRRCAEIYYEAEVYKKLEKITANRQQIQSKVTFP
jgi:YgiT-type zinc finger domain-containing protein